MPKGKQSPSNPDPEVPTKQQTKQCAVCDRTIVRESNRSNAWWKEKKTCSKTCAGIYRIRTRTYEPKKQPAQLTAAKKLLAEGKPDEALGVTLPQAQEMSPEEAVQNPQVAALAKELASRVLARRSLLQFTRKTHPDYQAGWVHADICRRLERFSRQVAERKSPRLMLLMPPRHGKSELASIRFPAWHLGHHPAHEIINVGYNLDLPMRFSRRVRELTRDAIYRALFPNTILDPDSQSVEAWNTTMGGGFTAAGVGGGITGKGAHVLIVDDPIKNMEEADSALIRDTLWDWYLSTAYTRLAPGGGVLVIETWWNDDDLAGRILRQGETDPGADQFEVVKYPALAEYYEYRHRETLKIERFSAVPTSTDGFEFLRKPGDALHRERYDESALQRIKANQAPRIWSALYQQNPIPDEGLYFTKDQFRTAPSWPQPYGLNVYTGWDFAIGEKQQNDYTVGATIVQDENDNLYVWNVVRFKGDAHAIIEAMIDAAEPWLQRQDTPYRMGLEDGQILRSIEPLLKKRMQERRIYPSYEILRPLTDKLARARSLQGRMQLGKVYFPAEASWLADTRHEMLRFPGGVHDDIVDALAWAVNLVVGKAPPRRAAPKPLKSWRDKLTSLMGAEGSHMAA